MLSFPQSCIQAVIIQQLIMLSLPYGHSFVQYYNTVRVSYRFEAMSNSNDRSTLDKAVNSLLNILLIII
ncbi:hypothetical protein JDW19_13510 [Paenibacillus polymyxa]|jgi:hypothetical protein|uniref:Uncharacterized protein n=1 Tax=Paenibacillus polymyxa TaxID=1406 RepID=A0A8I1J1W7_PAEPO|nr:hypothetical protein [Paenibacillus polymyxa]